MPKCEEHHELSAINGYKMNLMAILFKNSSSYEQMYFAEAAHLLFSKVTL